MLRILMDSYVFENYDQNPYEFIVSENTYGFVKETYDLLKKNHAKS